VFCVQGVRLGSDLERGVEVAVEHEAVAEVDNTTWKVALGNLATSRKFDERRSSSLVGLWVRMLAASMVTSTDDASGWSGSKSAVALTSAK